MNETNYFDNDDDNKNNNNSSYTAHQFPMHGKYIHIHRAFHFFYHFCVCFLLSQDVQNMLNEAFKFDFIL